MAVLKDGHPGRRSPVNRRELSATGRCSPKFAGSLPRGRGAGVGWSWAVLGCIAPADRTPLHSNSVSSFPGTCCTASHSQRPDPAASAKATRAPAVPKLPPEMVRVAWRASGGQNRVVSGVSRLQPCDMREEEGRA